MKPKSIKFVAMTIQEAKERLLFQLYHHYDERESANITDWVLEHLTGWKKIDRIINKSVKLSAGQQKQLNDYIIQLSANRPVQYVLGEAWFQNMRFEVNESTLIPRPETEELVEWLLRDFKSRNLPNPCILDIGTGSGCIPISLAKKLNGVRVLSADISAAALLVARTNAAKLNVNVDFIEADMLNEDNWETIPMLDAIISNPPYIPASQRSSMAANVVAFEPAVALFVPDDDPLIFYRAIASGADKRLSIGGAIYVEIHEELAGPVKRLFEDAGFLNTEIRKDMQGKDRMVKSVKV